MIRTLVGSRIPLNISVDGLGGKQLADDSVELSVTLLSKTVDDYGETVISSGTPIAKSEMLQLDADDKDNLLCIADTTGLSAGDVLCELDVSYYVDDDAGGTTSKKAKEIVVVDTDITLYTRNTL